MNWEKVVRALESEAGKAQDIANSYAVAGEKEKAVACDQTAAIIRALAASLKFGTT